jgi:3-methyladenine DNA glycosylase AlkC
MLQVGESVEAYKEFTRELMLRFERVTRELVRESREDREASLAMIERHSQESREEHRRLFEEMRELREESRAQTQALLAVIDRLNGGGAAPAT